MWDTLDFIYYLDRIGYQGWLSFDIFPFRMDGFRAVELCIKNNKNLIKLAEKIDKQELAQAGDYESKKFSCCSSNDPGSLASD